MCNNNTKNHIRNTTMCNQNIIMHNHSITSRSITMYLSTMHHEEIKVDTKVEDKVEEDLDEA
jgi:hypothetical protein